MSRRTAGEGTVYFDSGRGRWVGQAPPEKNWRTGKSYRPKVVGTPGESQASVRKRLHDLIAARSVSQGTPETVGQLVDQWVATLDPSSPGQSEGNIRRIRSQVRNHLSPVIGDVPLKSLTVDDVERWLEARKTRGGELLARSSLKKLRSVLAQSYDYAVKRRYTDWNPARVAALPREARVKREGRALTVPEIEDLFRVCARDRLGAWLVVGVTMGLRPGEISGLTWDAVDFEAGTVTVFQALAREGGRVFLKTTKTGRTRRLAMPDLTARALEEHRGRQTEERVLAGDWPAEWGEIVFVTPRGTPLDRSNTRRMVQGLVRRAGIEGPFTSYDVRHTASEFLASRVSMERLADLMGHRDTKTVQRHYRHPETNVIDVAAEVWRSGSISGSNRAREKKSGVAPG